MSSNKDEYQRLLSDHLATLTNDGRGLLGAIQASAELLRLDMSSTATLSNDEKAELLNQIINDADQMIRLIEWSIKERTKFRNSADENRSSR